MESISQAFDLCTDSLNTWVPLVYHPFFICVVAYYTTICGQGIAQPTDPSTGQLWLESLEAKQSFCRGTVFISSLYIIILIANC